MENGTDNPRGTQGAGATMSGTAQTDESRWAQTTRLDTPLASDQVYTQSANAPSDGEDQQSGGLSQMGTQVTQQAGQAFQQTQQAANKVTGQARRVIAAQFDTQKERATGTLDSVSGALRQTSQQLNGDNQAFIAQYVDRAAGAVEQTSQYLRQRDVDALVRDVENFGRRKSMWFLAGAFTLGLVAARFLKSSGDQVDDNQDSRAVIVAETPDYPLATSRL